VHTLGRPSTLEDEHITLAWLTSSVALNGLVTTTIVVKLWPARADPDKVGQVVSSTIGILAESAAAFTASGLLLIVSITMRSDYSIFFNRMFGLSAV
jgi:hypothetical protein